MTPTKFVTANYRPERQPRVMYAYTLIALDMALSILRDAARSGDAKQIAIAEALYDAVTCEALVWALTVEGNLPEATKSSGHANDAWRTYAAIVDD